jgi:hypothetical protein
VSPSLKIKSQISKNGKNMMYGTRDPKSRLWRVSLKHKFETETVQCNHAHENNNQKDLVTYLHAACFSPVKSMWITAIKMEASHLGQD